MKREFLKGLGLEDEAIDKIMAENGKDIEKFKSDVEAKEADVKAAKEQLEAASKQIEEFKGLDVDSIKKKADEYKENYEKAQQQLEEQEFNHFLDKQLDSLNPKKDSEGKTELSKKALKALLDMEKVKKTEKGYEGLEDQLETLKKNASFALEEVEPDNTDPKKPTFVRPGNKPSKKSPEEMTYSEALKYQQEHPDAKL